MTGTSDTTAQRRICVATITIGTNERRWLTDCLASLLASESQGIELTVWYVDNDSHDASTDLVSDQFPEVRIIRNTANLGFARANNIGMHAALEAGADYVFLVNPDTRTPPTLIAELTAFMQHWPEYGIIGPLQYAYTSGPLAIEEYNDWTRTALRWGEQHAFASDWPDHPSPASPEAGRALRTLEHAYVQGSALFARATMLDSTGLFDEVFHTYYEETDLCRRARWAGWRVALVLDLGIQHYGGGGTINAGRYRRIQMRRNRYYYLLTDIDWHTSSTLRLAGRWLRDDLRGRSVGGRTSPGRGVAETITALAWLARRAPVIAARRREHRELRASTELPEGLR